MQLKKITDHTFYLTLKIKYFHTKTNLQQLQQVYINDKESLISDTQIEFQQFRIKYNKETHSFADAEKLSVVSISLQLTITGIEAIESVKSKKCNESCIRYQAIFMDMEMPGLNGIQASAQILEIDRKIKIFIVSGYDKSQFNEEANTIGIKDYIVKPICKDVIQKIILENHL
ncbi:unnamed protein product [Paramecium octaurelia]|uniref:Response regulatory domain-containing protein n=1 Tax=Paramecium octaurelia TaxID=43137 RepID=A0A8S1W8N1_PAROT|nr:unnamed protein product [Paramecium octaurelia]